MTQTQYINPECEKFTISGVDYYVHPEFSPLGISMGADVINVRTKNVPKQSINKTTKSKIVGGYRPDVKKTVVFAIRRMLALAFILAKEGCYVAGRKYGDEDAVTIDNTEWRSGRKESTISVSLVCCISDNLLLYTFPTRISAHKFVQENSEWKQRFGAWVQRGLSRKGTLVSKCGAYQLISA